MPTGYTAAIKDGISVRDFIMRCARAFGACASIRESNMDTPIPDTFVPSDYHVNRIKEVMEEQGEIGAMTDEELNSMANKAFKSERERYEKLVAEREDLDEKYGKMWRDILRWKASEDHDELKTFMLDQIKMSTESDCDTSYLKVPIQLSGNEWKKGKVEQLLQDQAYHNKEYKKELTRAAKNNKWIQDLRDSLPSE